MSITAFNMRLSAVWSKRWKYAHWVFFALLGAYTLIAFFLNVFTCRPAVASYDAIEAGKLTNGFKCMSVRQMGTILRAINITMDYMLLATPVIILWRVQMDWKRKIKLFIVFGVGALACIGSVMTLVAKDHLKSDTLFNYTTLLAWTLVEMSLGVVAASLPIISALLPGPSMFASKQPEPPAPSYGKKGSGGNPNGSRPRSWLSTTLTASSRNRTLPHQDSREDFILSQKGIGNSSKSFDSVDHSVSPHHFEAGSSEATHVENYGDRTYHRLSDPYFPGRDF
jgi:hypothetical protein